MCAIALSTTSTLGEGKGLAGYELGLKRERRGYTRRFARRSTAENTYFDGHVAIADGPGACGIGIQVGERMGGVI